MQHSSKESVVCIDIYDEVGIGGGASGVSGGLLHPYSPKGSPHFFLNWSNLLDNELYFLLFPLLVSLAAKLLWRGAECWKESLNLLSIAEAAWDSRDSTLETQEFDQELNGFIVRRGFALPAPLQHKP